MDRTAAVQTAGKVVSGSISMPNRRPNPPEDVVFSPSDTDMPPDRLQCRAFTRFSDPSRNSRARRPSEGRSSRCAFAGGGFPRSFNLPDARICVLVWEERLSHDMLVANFLSRRN
jgi:hypothetical protein